LSHPTLGHIAGLIKNPRIKATAGTGISEYSQLLANDIITYQTRISIKEQELRDILDLEQFKLYRQVLINFALVLSLKAYCFYIATLSKDF
jgi:uncharacterized protein YehS (DUF1456 family)